eukprot:9496004-Pyramimonas_sp.AAC.1
MLQVATLCSGIEAVIQGHENLMISHKHVAACDKDLAVRRIIKHNFSAEKVYPDIRELRQLPEHHMMWAGFPCQPSSQTGNREGVFDALGRGAIILHILRL